MNPPVAVFKWMGPLPDEPTGVPERFSNDDGEQLTLEAAYPAASALAAALRAAGWPCDDPLNEELGWGCDVGVAEKTISLYVHWTGIDYPPHQYIAIQWHVRRKLRERLLRRHPAADALAFVQQVLDLALRLVPQVADIHWLTDEEFAACYARGKPLSP